VNFQENKAEIEESIESVFEKKKREILSNKSDFKKNGRKVKSGVETEYFLIEDSLEPLESPSKRNQIIKDVEGVKKELGIDSVEIATVPIYLEDLKKLEESIRSREDELTSKAEEKGLEVIRSGTNPFRSLENLKLSEKKFFQQINNYYNKKGTETIGEVEKVDVGDAKSVSLISAIHTNIEASSFEDAISKANYIYMISPYISALSGNARFLEGKDTGLSDLRMILWSKSHSMGDKQIGRLESYYSDMNDYLDRVGSWPFILERPEKVISDSISRYWKDSRIKFLEDDLVVESRIASTQPSVVEDVAVHAFCIGRVLYAQDRNEQLLNIEKVNENREAALRDGLDSKLYSPEGVKLEASELLLDEIEKARKGLEANNIKQKSYLELLESRVKSNKTPSDRVAEDMKKVESEENSKALFDAVNNNVQEVE